MSKNLVARLSVIVYALIIAQFGINHITDGTRMAGLVPHYFPAPVFLIYFTGFALILAAIAFLINIKVQLAGYLLGTLLVIIVATLHFPLLMSTVDDLSRMTAKLNTAKDLGLAAAAFYIGSKHS